MAENEKNFLIVDTDEAGQVTGMRRMETGDTISNDRLNTDIRNAPSDASTALATAQSAQTTATSAIDEAQSVSSTVYINSGTWGAGGIDPTDLANLKDASNVIADFSGVSGTFASSNTGAGVIVDADIAIDAALSGGKIATETITNTQISPTAAIDGTKLASNSITDDQLDTGVALANIGPGGIPSTALSAGAAFGNLSANSITADKIATNAITTDELGPSAVQTANLNGSAVTTEKIANLAVTTEKYAASSITNAKIKATAAIEGSKLADNTITATQIAPTTITNSEISTGADIAITKLQDITGPVLLGKTTTGDGDITTISKTNAKAFVDVDDLEASSNFPVTTLNNNLDANNNEINGLTAIKGTTTTVLTLSGKEPLLIGTDGIKFGVGNPSYPQLSSLTNVITELAAASATPAPVGGGSAVASALFVANGSSVEISGADGTVIDTPEGGSILSLNVTDGKLAFRKLRAINVQDGAIGSNQLATNAASDNIAAGALNSIAFNKLPLISAESFVGNNNSVGGNMKQFTAAQAKTILDIGGSYSVGTTAPTSPTGGDLWYNTTDDELYTYDSGRSHWLGAPHYISLGKTTSTAPGVGHYLYVGHAGTTATTQERGWLVPHDMVITGWRGHTKSTFDGWTFRIDKNSGGTNTTGIVSTGALGAVDTFSDFTLDVDVAAGDILGVPGVTGTSTIDNSTVIIKIQRKGA